VVDVVVEVSVDVCVEENPLTQFVPLNNNILEADAEVITTSDRPSSVNDAPAGALTKFVPLNVNVSPIERVDKAMFKLLPLNVNPRWVVPPSCVHPSALLIKGSFAEFCIGTYQPILKLNYVQVTNSTSNNEFCVCNNTN
jgi:hypothetical protein